MKRLVSIALAFSLTSMLVGCAADTTEPSDQKEESTQSDPSKAVTNEPTANDPSKVNVSPDLNTTTTANDASCEHAIFLEKYWRYLNAAAHERAVDMELAFCDGT